MYRPFIFMENFWEEKYAVYRYRGTTENGTLSGRT